MFSNFLRIIFKFLMVNKLVGLIAFVYCLKTTRIGKKKKYKILALNYERFRGELEILSKNKNIEINILPFSWQTRFINYFLNNEEKRLIGTIDSIKKNNFKKFEDFLILFLKKYYSFKKIDLVIGCAVHYKHDITWGKVSKKIGIPYVVLHKECLYGSNGFIHDFKNKWLVGREKFSGSHVIVHNYIVRDLWIKNKFINKENISVGGNMRMQDFIKKKPMKVKKIDLLFFSFAPGVGLSSMGLKMFPKKNKGFYNLSYNTHKVIFQYALENPDKKVVIKTKWGDEWINYIIDIAKKNKIEISKLSNLKIISDYKFNVHNLILSSDTIVGFNSTTVLESSIKNKNVIIPYFDEAKDKVLKKYVFFHEYLGLFNIAKSQNDLKKKINKCLFKKSLDFSMEKRKLVFSKFVSPYNQNSINIQSSILLKILMKSKYEKRLS